MVMMSLSWQRFMASLPPGVVLGRPAGQALLRDCILALAPDAHPASAPANTDGQPMPRSLLWVDDCFEHWPLDEQPMLQALAGWLRLPGHSLQLIARDYAGVERLHPRFARWRINWSHRIRCWGPHDDKEFGRFRGVLGDACAIERLDAPDWRWRALTNTVQLQAVHNDVADFLQRCEAAWPTTILGL